ncbi:ACP S-malonyltransferase [[Clostridium] spiroforme]|nr:ACP S-malonyltransferase [Thomasclavelia spiroformis]MBM6879441.1 ACP S-malonyltransferase [Thomasclavelia spiroformis]
MKIGFLYAGQGSQKVGMGQSLYDSYEEVRNLFDQYPDLKELCFEGPIETLSKTSHTQPCMVLFAVAVSELLKKNGIVPDYVAGLSLGEYSALNAAGVFDNETVIDVVRLRGQAMEQAVQGIDSKMVAVMGLSREVLSDICQQASDLGVVSIANFNCPGQLVVTGERPAVEKAEALAKEAGARRMVPLNTSGPFHTSLLESASVALKEKFETVDFHDMQIPVIFNTTAQPLQEGVTVGDMLVKQVKSSVYFEDSIRYMIAQGVDTFVEIGPGKVLSGFVRKIDKTKKVYQVEDKESLDKLIEELQGE